MNIAGELSAPHEAEKGQHYSCPSCGERALFRKGPKNAAHFSHTAGNACSAETVLHKTAKLLIQQTVTAWRAGQASAPCIHRGVCRSCGGGIIIPLPDYITHAQIERRLDDGSIADVALCNVGDEVAATVEIYVTHAVDKEKATRLPVHFVELAGEEVIANPLLWTPRTHNLKAIPPYCPQCREAYSRFHAGARAVAESAGIPLPTAYYRYGVSRCRSCQREILLYAWPRERFPDDEAVDGHPMPETFRHKVTAKREYWLNTCPYCHAIQTDFIHHGPLAFFGVDCSGLSPADWRRDMIRIARHSVANGLLDE